MIITDLSAKNVLKYASLELQDLPLQGMIAVSGQNESGKSTIGETLCFALFGRTFSLGPDDLDKVIRWGETSCQVSCSFQVDGRGHYEVARFLDNDGNHSARLNEVGKEGAPLARGVGPVDEALYDLIGFDFDEFVDSFYLAQREITTPHPHSHTVKSMAGIAALEYVGGEIAAEINEAQRAINDAEADISDIGRQLADLAVEDGRLVGLAASRQAGAEECAGIEAQMGALEQAGTDYRDTLPVIRKAAAARRSSILLGLLVLVLAAGLGGAWAALTQIPDHPYSELLARMLRLEVPGWSADQVPMLAYAGAAFGLVGLLLIVRSVRLKGRISRLSQAGPALVEQLDAVPWALAGGAGEAESRAATGPLTELSPDGEVDDSELVEEAESRAEEAVAEPARAEPVPDHRYTLTRSRIAECRAGESEVRDLVSAELASLRHSVRICQGRVVRLDQAIELEKDRLARAERLHGVQTDLHATVAGYRRRVDLRELSRELLAGASRSMSQRFNHELRNLVGRTLPLFTDGRYEHLQIDEDLQVRVFSNEKRDYMDLDEISSGTQRQIMLALRLALAQELVNSTALGKQFVFLDEPFAFFDDERTRTSIKVLPRLSDELSQVWISSQAFPLDAEFALHIRCARQLDGIAEAD